MGDQVATAETEFFVLADADADGLSDHVERTAFGTDPGSPDSDRDGQADGFEVSHGAPPMDASRQARVPRLRLSATPAGWQLEWDSPGFRLDNDPTVAGPWTPAETGVTNDGRTFRVPIVAAEARQFFRLRE